MALVGSGSYRTIPNVYSSSSFVDSEIDQGFGAIIDQVGGTSWTNGAPVTRAGNLDENNFSSTPGFSNANKTEAYAAYYMNGYVGTPYSVINSVAVNLHTIQVVPTPMLMDRLSLSYSGPIGIATFLGTPFTADVVVNGNLDNPVFRWSPPRIGTVFPGVPIYGCYNATTYYVERNALEGAVSLTTGDVVSVTFSSGVGNLVGWSFSLACRSVHLP